MKSLLAAFALSVALPFAAYADEDVPACKDFAYVEKANAEVNPQFLKLGDVQFAKTKEFFESKGKPVPDEVKVIYTGHTDQSPDKIFFFGFDANGCLTGAVAAPMEDFAAFVLGNPA